MRKAKPLNNEQKCLLFEMLRNNTGLTGMQIMEFDRVCIEKGLIKPREIKKR